MRGAQMRSGNSYFLPSPMLLPEGTDTSKMRTKYIVVSGGVCSSLGKGVTTSSIGALLRTQGYRVCSVKIDPYINIDAGLMSPFEHGEVYVLEDGGEVDLDLGNYERWMDIHLKRDHNITTGKVYNSLIAGERKGKFLGKTVQLVPHFTNDVVERILTVSKLPVDNSGLKPHVCLIELGGTVGDLESAPFIEALRTMRFTLLPEDFILLHCTYLPVMGGGQKTKPSQHSCRTLLSLGLSPDFLICRSALPLEATARAKLSQQCGIHEKYIIGAHDVQNLYQIPPLFAEQGVIAKIERKLKLEYIKEDLVPSINFPSLEDFKRFSEKLLNPTRMLRIAFVGKYVVGGSDAYFSVLQTFEHCCLHLGVGIEYVWINSEQLEDPNIVEAAIRELKNCDGIFVPGGFGNRGIDGKVLAAKVARENNIPYLGVCLGFQTALIEFARSQCGWTDATSEEFDKDGTSQHHILRYMPEIDRETMGANMRLGARQVSLLCQDGIAKTIYSGATTVLERHRHRFEFNMKYYEDLKAKGVVFSGADSPIVNEDSRMEIFELPTHPFFLGVQFHPEFFTTHTEPSPPFLAFVAATAKMNVSWPINSSHKIN